MAQSYGYWIISVRIQRRVLSQAVHEDTVRLSMGTVIQQGPRIAERQFL